MIWQFWENEGSFAIRLISSRNKAPWMLTFLAWDKSQYYRGIEILGWMSSTATSPFRALICTDEKELWSLFWFVLPAQLKAMEK